MLKQSIEVVIIDDHGKVERGRGLGVLRVVLSLF